MPTFPVLAHIHCIAIEGADARRFAQTQFSGDVDALAPGHWQWNAWLTAQGRVQALMQLVDAGDGRLLGVLRGGDSQAIHAALARYLLRSKAKLAIQPLTARAGGPLPSGTVQRDADNMVLGYGSHSLRLAPVDAGAVVDISANVDWRLTDIRAGWPTLAADAQPKFLPPALGLERLGAVAFDKGCYPGQEIVARLHYRGGHKHGLCHISGSQPLPLGDVRSATGALQASILDTVARADGCDSLAILDIDVSNQINILDDVYTINRKFGS
ncbi:MAG: YgfZ/GcvT domain-containing protein [Rhodanobacteraceae bacterium]